MLSYLKLGSSCNKKIIYKKLFEGGGIEEIKQFQKYFLENNLNFRIIVFNDRRGNSLFCDPIPVNEKLKNIFLYFEDSHFVLVKKLERFFDYIKFCKYCFKGFSYTSEHRNCIKTKLMIKNAIHAV
jgi:hypothetical protein